MIVHPKWIAAEVEKALRPKLAVKPTSIVTCAKRMRSSAAAAILASLITIPMFVVVFVEGDRAKWYHVATAVYFFDRAINAAYASWRWRLEHRRSVAVLQRAYQFYKAAANAAFAIDKLPR